MIFIQAAKNPKEIENLLKNAILFTQKLIWLYSLNIKAKIMKYL